MGGSGHSSSAVDGSIHLGSALKNDAVAFVKPESAVWLRRTALQGRKHILVNTAASASTPVGEREAGML
jgi:hypothetical protein